VYIAWSLRLLALALEMLALNLSLALCGGMCKNGHFYARQLAELASYSAY